MVCSGFSPGKTIIAVSVIFKMCGMLPLDLFYSSVLPLLDLGSDPRASLGLGSWGSPVRSLRVESYLSSRTLHWKFVNGECIVCPAPSLWPGFLVLQKYSVLWCSSKCVWSPNFRSEMQFILDFENGTIGPSRFAWAWVLAPGAASSPRLAIAGYVESYGGFREN